MDPSASPTFNTFKGTLHTVKGTWVELRGPSDEILYQLPLDVKFNPEGLLKLRKSLAEALKPGSKRPLSYKRLGKLLEASYVTVWRWVSGKCKPNPRYQALLQGCLILCSRGLSQEALRGLGCATSTEKLSAILQELHNADLSRTNAK